MEALISNKDIRRWVIPDEFASVAIILDFLSAKKIQLRDTDEAFVLKKQIQGRQALLAKLQLERK